MKIKSLVLSILLTPIFAFAQTGTPPSAGLTPRNPFYFLDRLGEVLQEFVAFNPETKIRLQIGFAAERIAEIQIDMKAKDVDAKGLSIAQNRLEKHLSKASKLVSDEEKNGKDVREWANLLKDEFEVSKNVLELSFESAKDALEDEREELKKELESAKKSNDAARVETLTHELNNLEDEKDELEHQKEESKQSLEVEKKQFDDENGELEEELENISDSLDELEDEE